MLKEILNVIVNFCPKYDSPYWIILKSNLTFFLEFTIFSLVKGLTNPCRLALTKLYSLTALGNIVQGFLPAALMYFTDLTKLRFSLSLLNLNSKWPTNVLNI